MSISVTTRSALIQRTAVVATATSALLLLSATPAAFARPEPGPRTVTDIGTSVQHCLLQRAGTQYVRCDDLTGNGVPAPTWVPEY
ncbi:hypothetical protein [Knoellia aerolata]|uniref:Chitin-binding type-3 domain-containing protein n=1 Tax=Knoellia aerolata DSM 18566 TaxID=1385519 RepID=A0A0A0K1L6_9MICO|nr:hypothetical protein [Knoellia aerolata]KGN42227.1 hypothetical protein N801_01420 [Knoellia aerolata DSM 18566]